MVAGYRLAHLGDRFLSVTLDTLIGLATFIVIGMWSAVKWGGVTASGSFVEGKAEWLSLPLTLLAGFLYYSPKVYPMSPERSVTYVSGTDRK